MCITEAKAQDKQRAIMGSDDKSPPALTPTKETYQQLQAAYDAINSSLFDGALPECLITLQRRRKAYGYFAGERFQREDGQAADEIALNPAYFGRRPLENALSTLAHEMVHLWQHHFGTPGRGRYHNREWAAKMTEIGLQASSTGAPGGSETGDTMSHYVIEGGSFARLAYDLHKSGYRLTWAEKPQPANDKSGTGKSGQRVKYACPQCGQCAWAKHEAALMCGTDKVSMEPVE